MEIDVLWKLLDSIQTQIKSFDTKAQIAMGLDGLVAGLLSTEVPKALEYSASGMRIRFGLFVFFTTISLVSASTSLIYALRTVHPQLRLRQPMSHFFFCHLVERYGRDFKKAAKELADLPKHQAQEEISTQILTVSIICDAKAARCSRALMASGISLAAYLITIYPLGSMFIQKAVR